MDLHPQFRPYTPKYPTLDNFDRRLLDAPDGIGRRLAPPIAACVLAALLSGCGQPDYHTEGAPPPPDYVSEADVLAVILDEADRLGLSLSGDGGAVDLGDASVEVDLSGEDGRVGFSYIDYDAGDASPAGDPAPFENDLLSAWETPEGLGLCVLEAIDRNDRAYDEDALREAFRAFVGWLRENGRL